MNTDCSLQRRSKKFDRKSDGARHNLASSKITDSPVRIAEVQGSPKITFVKYKDCDRMMKQEEAYADNLPLHRVRNLVNDGGDHSARPAPWGPEIHQHWKVVLQNEFFEGAVRHFEGCNAVTRYSDTGRSSRLGQNQMNPA
jgi:hypothetical protein